MIVEERTEFTRCQLEFLLSAELGSPPFTTLDVQFQSTCVQNLLCPASSNANVSSPWALLLQAACSFEGHQGSARFECCN